MSEEEKRVDEIQIQIAKIQADKELALKELESKEQAKSLMCLEIRDMPGVGFRTGITFFG